MPNVVEITVKMDDATGPGMASVLARVAALKEALKGIGFNFDDPNLASQLLSIKQKMQAAGLADFLDFNLNQGQIESQLLNLRRKIQNARISDLLDLNLNQAQLQEQLAAIQQEQIQIPVGFDVSKLPTLGDVSAIKAPIQFEMPSNFQLPKLGETFDFRSIDEATQAFRDLGIAADALQHPLLDVDNLSTLLDTALAHTASNLDTLGMAFSNAAKAAVQQSYDNETVANLSQIAATRFAMEQNAIEGVWAQADKMNRVMSSARATQIMMNAAVKEAIPLWQSGGGWWGFLTGKIQLFGGALTHLGIPPIIGAASGLHILVDSAIELATVLVPATIGMVAFGAAAAPTVGDIYQQMLALFNTTRALGKNIYPMSGAFLALANDVQPQVYMLFGEALSVMNTRTNEFAILAEGAGTAVDHLGARMAAAIESNNMSQLLGHASQDITGIGTFFGNLFGIIGNVLHVMPGYAGDLLSILDGISGAVEAFTGNTIVQDILGFGIALHGAILWLGLFTTAFVWAGNGMVGFLAKLGLVEEGALAFDAIQFGTGLKLFGSYLLDTIGALFTFAGAEDVATGATGAFEAATLTLGAINPLVWVGVAVGALVGLVYWLSKADSATTTYANNIRNSLSNTPISGLNIQLLADSSDAMGNLAVATAQYAEAEKGVKAADASGALRDWNYQSRTAAVNMASDKNALDVVVQAQQNYNAVLKAAGYNMGLVNDAGITSHDIISANKNQLQQYIIEVQAEVDAQRALSLGIGRSAAAMNAQSNLYITEGIPAMQKMTQAETAVITTINDGESAFSAWRTALLSTSGAAQKAHYDIGALNANSNLYAQDLYQSAIPAAQALISALQNQDISTHQLTMAVADEVKQMLPFTKNNQAAKSIMVDLINNALGPGTVSMKTLDSWVQNNSTDLAKFNKIIADSTIKAGALANVLQTNLNKQFVTALLNESGASSALQNYTNDIIDNTTKTAAGKSDRQQLIDDLINIGDSATQARRYVDSLQTSVDNMHGNSIGVGVVGAWSVQQEQNAQAVAHLTAEAKHGMFSTGGQVPGWGGGDIYRAWLEPGEAVVDKERTRKYSDVLGWMGVPGFRSGGMMGILGMPGDAASLGMRKANLDLNTLVWNAIHADERAARNLFSSGSGNAILKYAESFIGKVPYIWGGDTPNGWDCSGFVKWVYDHFGYGSIPRTSQEQWNWVKHTPNPIPGGLAFFSGSDGTVTSPGHVGIIVNGNEMVDAYATGFGTRFNSITGSSGAVSGFGVPPGGLGGNGAPGGGGPGGGNPAQNASLAHSLYATQMNPTVWSAWNNVAMAESGWSNIARNPTSGAYGIAQALPYTKYPKAGWPPWAGGSANPTAQINWMWDYMAGTYGGPIGAWQHEKAFHWYGDGIDGIVHSPTLIGVGERGSERVTVTPLGKGGGKTCLYIDAAPNAVSQFFLNMLKEYVRIEGGGDVQVAFGTTE